MAFAAISKPGLHMNTKLYTGDGSATQAITGVGFQPDWIWIKSRDATHDHYCFQSILANKYGLEPSDTSAERTPALGSFNSDGFTFASTDGFYNTNSGTYVSWNWKAGGATGSSNNDGSIATTVTANTTAGFSIVKFNKSSLAANSTMGHGLGKVPKAIFFKNISNADSWYAYHEQLGGGAYLVPNDTNNAQTSTGFMNSSTAPTTSVFTQTSTFWGTSNHDVLAFCFAEIKGYSKFGSYMNTGSADGPYCYTGFQPELVIIKSSDRNGSNWNLLDRKRPGRNRTDYRIKITGSTEQTGSANSIDILSTGFKIRGIDDDVNAAGAGDDYLYWAWAKNPFVANVGESIPTTAF